MGGITCETITTGNLKPCARPENVHYRVETQVNATPTFDFGNHTIVGDLRGPPWSTEKLGLDDRGALLRTGGSEGDATRSHNAVKDKALD